MGNYETILRSGERVVFDLRAMYGLYGYTQYKMGKFESYELYARNKDFLGSDAILTFTDSKGRLKALRPDVTLSIAKNSDYIPGVVQKFYYNEAVYRMAKSDRSFRETMSTGVECIGDLGAYDVCEVISLAVKSLERVSNDYILDISHMGIVRGMTKLLKLPEDAEEEVLRYIGDKNVHGVKAICRENGVEEDMIANVEALITTYGPMDKVLGEIGKLVQNNTMQRAVDELNVIHEVLQAEGLDKNVRFDFSVVNDMGYYNGVIFQGFIKGLSKKILSGGRYDNLMIKMGKKSGAIGFSLSPDLLEDLNREEKTCDVDVVILDRPGESLMALNKAVRELTAEGYSVSVQKEIPANLRYGKLVEVVDGEVTEIEADN